MIERKYLETYVEIIKDCLDQLINNKTMHDIVGGSTIITYI